MICRILNRERKYDFAWLRILKKKSYYLEEEVV